MFSVPAQETAKHREKLACKDSPTKLYDGAQMTNFCVLYFSEPLSAHFRPALYIRNFALRSLYACKYGRHSICDCWE